MDVLGHLDLCGPELIEGWLYGSGNDHRRLSLQVFMGDELLGECVADRLRPDLAEAKMGDGRCAFSFRIPAGTTGNFRSVRLRVAGSVLYLLPDDYTVIAEPQPAPQRLSQTATGAISEVLRPGLGTPGLVKMVPRMPGVAQTPSSDRATPITRTASGQSA